MKYVLAACALLFLASGSAAAEQSTGFSHQEARDPMFTTANCTSPYDFNHRGAGSDKSDELGVAYYNEM